MSKLLPHRGCTMSLLDPDFAQNRLLYFTYFAPPR